MSFVAIIHYQLQPEQEGLFEQYEAELVEIILRCEGDLVAGFVPEKLATGVTPDRIHVLRFHSKTAYDAYLADPELQDEAIKQLHRSVIRATQILMPQNAPLSLPGEETYLEPDESNSLPTVVSQGRLIPGNITTYLSGKRVSVEQRMRTNVRKWEAAKDRRVIFAHTYLLMTENMRRPCKMGNFMTELGCKPCWRPLPVTTSPPWKSTRKTGSAPPRFGASPCRERQTHR